MCYIVHDQNPLMCRFTYFLISFKSMYGITLSIILICWAMSDGELPETNVAASMVPVTIYERHFLAPHV